MRHGDLVHSACRASVEGLTVDYGSGPVLQDVTLRWDRPESTAIVGPSGSGKSTLLYCLAGLERPTSGSVQLLGTDVTAAGVDEVCALRLGRVGFVFQRADLLAELTLRQNIEFPLELLRWKARLRRERVEDLIDRLDLAECADRRPDSVSGGQAQRAAIARAVACRPEIVFADEPTGALDSRRGEEALGLLLEHTAEVGALLITVTHDATVAAAMHRVVGLADGRVTSDTTPANTNADGPGGLRESAARA